MNETILSNLPGLNCGICGCESCEEFADLLVSGKKTIPDCRVIVNKKNALMRQSLESVLKTHGTVQNKEKQKIVGLIDSYKADIVLEPLEGEHSCRETLMPTSTGRININDIVRYRPLGCPITHFAKIVTINNLLITVHIIGPVNRNNEQAAYHDLGICMVVGFEGKYSGAKLKVGETVRFLPKHCMMQKVHSGVVVELKGNNVVIEGIDLKVWAPPEACLTD